MTEQPCRPGYDLKMTAEEINRLPVAAYEGPVRIIASPDELEGAAGALRREAVLGFDTETKPSFKRGEKNPLSLVQLAGSRCVYILQLQHLPSCACMHGLLADSRVVKAGVDIAQDLGKLRDRIGGQEYNGFVDIALMAKQAGLKNFSLRGLAAVLLGVRITKGMRVSNWGRKALLPGQIKYAATDAWISRQLYLRLREPQAGASPEPPAGPH